ncbi:hypothetical protein [Stenotrophomonas sp. SrG]|uniref:hypothetical protein n=1 Tax=Stenotrophomonas sp. SrG TaxID=3414430 RepID=UPI003CF098C9
MSALVLAPATGPTPGRMKQPTKAALRHWLVLAAERTEQLQAELTELRANGATTSTEREQLLTELVEAAARLGHHETLRSTSDETIELCRARVQTLRAALIGGR